LRIVGADHYGFTDVPLYAPLYHFGKHRVDPERLSRTIRSYAVAFFERVLTGTPSALLVPGEKKHNLMTLASWPFGSSR
jgi:hypothetical protein